MPRGAERQIGYVRTLGEGGRVVVRAVPLETLMPHPAAEPLERASSRPGREGTEPLDQRKTG